MKEDKSMNNTVAQNNTEDRRKLKGAMAEVYEWLEAIAFALAIVVLLFTFVFRIVSVSGSSMEPTLHNENRVLVSCLFYTPAENDIVIIVNPEDAEYNKPLVKRVIAVGGQTIQIVDGIAYVDGQPKIIDGLDTMMNSGNAFDFSSPVYVPEGYVFVLGDNRNDSLDSRDARIGMVNVNYIIGKVQFRIFPFDQFGGVE